MTIFETLAWVIVTIICLVIAPFMTVGIIFIGAGWKFLGYIFIVLGIVHMFVRILKFLND